MIINLRGTSGSGKSTVGHHLVDTYHGQEIFEDGWNKTRPKLVGYQCDGDLVVLGPYRAKGGGMDILSAADRSQLPPFIARYAREHKHLFFEALVLSSTVHQYITLAQEFKGTNPFVFPFMDTPVDLCIKRIYYRNGNKPIKEEAVRGHIKTLVSVRRRMEEAGMTCPTMDYLHPFECVEGMLKAGGWDPS